MTEREEIVEQLVATVRLETGLSRAPPCQPTTGFDNGHLKYRARHWCSTSMTPR